MTNENLDKHWGKFSHQIGTVIKCFKSFRTSHISSSDVEPSGSLVESTTSEFIAGINDLIMCYKIHNNRQ